MEKKGKQIKIFNFNESYVPPTYKWNAKLGILEWGTSNLYPNYLLDLYNSAGSTTHKSIINKKVKLIAGKGFEEITSPELAEFIKENKLTKEVKKAALDYEVFNGFAFEIVWNNEGTKIASMQHIPFHKLRLGIESDELKFPHVWFSLDWSQYKKEGYEPEFIRLFNPNLRVGKQIVYYSEYNPQTDGLYPIPGYSTTMNWIEMDYQVSVFHLNQLKQGYSPSFILNFATGIPSEEEQDLFFKEFKKNFSGAQNAGKIILTYSEGSEQKPELTPITLNDSDERFIMLQDMTEKNIVMGHEAPASLFILTPGKLGSTQEREELLKEFQSSYVTPRQENIEEVLNEILSTSFNEEIKLKQYQNLYE